MLYYTTVESTVRRLRTALSVAGELDGDLLRRLRVHEMFRYVLIILLRLRHA